MKYSLPEVELLQIESSKFSPLISKCMIKVCWVGDEPNRNRSVITKQVAEDMAYSLRGAAIVGKYNAEKEDFEQHNKVLEIKDGKINFKPDTQPYGFVDLNAKIWFQKFQDKDNEIREYLCTEGWLWTGQFPECQRIIERGNNQSMELSEDPKFLSAHWAKDVQRGGSFFIINEAIISKLCILGEDMEPCFEGAAIEAPKVEFVLEDGFKQQLLTMMAEIKNILNEGGVNMSDEVKVEEFVEEPIAEEPVAEEEVPEVEEPVAEDPVVEPEPAPEYVLEEIPEYTALQGSYAELESKFNELSSAHETLKTEYETLAQFKAEVVKKEKQSLIDSFYMLSDEQKADVVQNIDTYSLEDIKSKLCVICVDNKVSFAEEAPSEEPITYSLDDTNYSKEASIPEWIKVVKNINK